ncbi:hypothetical protein PGT21_018862 [Puccinia graminis f. sp. tritici]|uniref:Uncharacterized protein n=2 Tax=Puccinia graminis f. sp. tritici TaxID=56615 RepID=E3KWL1_PUCGT|nr:uncharacterized protein PGTG_14644 [Puccinia graminis f. sp. tritici CRL 75-36-700-3]XP_003336753.1 uncharacterized protein PGTG_18008 [Puccinia graminis f. sp. tritici CRL 75-36-700-3]EFP88678.1 hypothetical protein PGTG_14644 [Puccinia graminis f. sp. tritici CRL 75-36-700-3]EFP92334.1 hypothetical protein PGTG_18008 [Puccinia graminis f. sp. tritici CRL 75-36-700-3]KAA1116564.1 hypothetical protein PGT21_018862 [Puccinia graminis f. sp. tritici]
MGPEAMQALDVLDQHKRACKDRYYRQALKRESNKARYVDTYSKVNCLKQMIAKDRGFQVTVKHPRLWYLLDTDIGGPIQNLGTPPTPRWDAQGQLGLREKPLLLLFFFCLLLALLFFVIFAT